MSMASQLKSTNELTGNVPLDSGIRRQSMKGRIGPWIQPVYCATGEHFRRIFKHDIFDPEKLADRKQSTPTEEQLGYLPLENVVIASIEEWEQLMSCVARGDIDLVPFLREVAAANQDGAISVMFLGQMLQDKTSVHGLSSLIKNARDDSESELIQMLSGIDATLVE